MSMTMIYEKMLNARHCIEETILHFKPDISDKELLDLREQLFYKVYKDTPSYNGFSSYVRDYSLYARKKGETK